MTGSSMKYKSGSSQAYQRLSSVWPEVIMGTAGFGMYGASGGIVGVVLGWCIAFTMQVLDSHRASELEWNDIDLAVLNYAIFYRPGAGNLVFEIGGKQVHLNKQPVLRVTEGERFVIWYRTDQWHAVLDEADTKLFSDLCQKKPVKDPKWDKGKTFLIPQNECPCQVMEVCLVLVKTFIAKAGVPLRDITVRDQGAPSAIWVDVVFNTVSPVPICSSNFKGKKDGRPILTLTDRKGYWILHEDGALEQFVDFESWWKSSS